MLLRDSWIEFNIDNLKYNINKLKNHSNKKMIAVIKANGYGNGDQFVAETAVEAGADYLAVSSLDEALSLRKEKISAPILILGYVNPSFYQLLIDNDITTTVVSLDWVNEIIKFPIKNLKVHIKVDTGMNRIGINNLKDIRVAIDKLSKALVNIEGIFTHFACSDFDDLTITNMQYGKFKEIVQNLNYHFEYIHCNNTDATIGFIADIANATRCGLGIYGYSSSNFDLKPCVQLFSKIINIKKIKAGEFVGYGATYTATEDEFIATIPIGYADGWIRKNQGRNAYVGNEYAQFVGRICMDQCMLKVSKMYPVGTPVELFGNNISLKSVADDLNTIPYEILTILSDRLTKIYISNNKVIASTTPRFEK